MTSNMRTGYAHYKVQGDADWESNLQEISVGNDLEQIANDLIDKVVHVDSRVYAWAHTPVAPPAFEPPDDWLQRLDLSCTFKTDVPRILDSLKENQVVCIGAPTGAGRSTVMPGVVYEANKRALRDGECEGFDPGDGQRIIHLLPSSEKVHQNYGHVAMEYATKAGFVVGAFSSDYNSRGEDTNHVEEGKTNYLFSTFPFAEDALYGDNRIHTVVIDVLEEMTPILSHVLSLVKTKLLKKEIYRVVLLSDILSYWICGRLHRYFTDPDDSSLLSVDVLFPGRSPLDNRSRARSDRVSRVTDDHYYEKRTNVEILRNELAPFERQFTTAILTLALSDNDDFYKPGSYKRDLHDLIMEAGTYGMLCARVFSREYTPILPLRVDAVGQALNRAFKGVPLDIGTFLLYCAANHCILPGAALAASFLAGNRALESIRRDDPRNGLNAWPEISGCPGDSDMIVYADFMMNAILSHTSQDRDNTPRCFVPLLPTYFSQWTNYEGLTETVAIFYRLLAGLNSLQLCDDYYYWHADTSGVTIYPHRGFRFAHMDKKIAHRFNVCLLAAFGHRVMTTASSYPQQKPDTSTEPDVLQKLQKLWNYRPPSPSNVLQHDTYTLPGVKRDGQFILVQGEQARIEAHPLVVYYAIPDPNPTDPICTTHLHQFTPVDYLLYGNCHGATTDIVQCYGLCLQVQTNTGSVRFCFDSKNTLEKVASFRKAMKILPGALLFGYADYCTKMVDLIDKMPTPPTAIVQCETEEPILVSETPGIQFFDPSVGSVHYPGFVGDAYFED